MKILDRLMASISLVNATKEDNNIAVHKAIAHGAFINYKRGKALSNAAANNNLKMVKTLLDADADMFAGNHATMKSAIKHDSYKIMHHFFELGHDKDTETMRKFLLLAAKNDSHNAARTLIKHGAKITDYKVSLISGFEKSTPLYYVLRNGKDKMLNTFLKHTKSIYWFYTKQVKTVGKKNRNKIMILLRDYRKAGIINNVKNAQNNLDKLDIDLGLAQPKTQSNPHNSKTQAPPAPLSQKEKEELEQAKKESQKAENLKKSRETSRLRRKKLHDKIKAKKSGNAPKI